MKLVDFATVLIAAIQAIPNPEYQREAERIKDVGDSHSEDAFIIFIISWRIVYLARAENL